MELNKNIDDLKQAGASRVVCLLKEDLQGQVEEFRKDFWPGELFLDESKGFYKALGGGKFRKMYNDATFVTMLVNPFADDPVKGKLRKVKAETNLKGEGFIHGGLYVMRKTGVAELGFAEENLGDVCSINVIKEAVQAAKAA